MDSSYQKLVIRQPDDWHVHFRDGPILKNIVQYTARVFRRAIVMPNLAPPITSIESAISYRKRIEACLSRSVEFSPLMTAYITDELDPKVLKDGYRDGIFTAAKLYPANATTNSEYGVSNLRKIDPLLETMEDIGMPLLIHGEVTDNDVDIFDREAVFIDRELLPLLKRYPSLKVVLEHITTEKAVEFVKDQYPNIAATITPHHLHINRNSLFQGGLRSDFYCLPVAKRERHRIALRNAATSGYPCFFLGTDSAPHLRHGKESSCGCAGIFNAPNALESYAEVFDEEGALDKLEDFASNFGPSFYRLPLNEGFITLLKKPHLVPEEVPGISGNGIFKEPLVPFHSGESLQWLVAEGDPVAPLEGI